MDPSPVQYVYLVPVSPPVFDRPKFYDNKRETDNHPRDNADVIRPEMVQELHGKTIWLPKLTFQTDILPKPPAHVMLTDEELKTFQIALKEMLDNHKGRAKCAHKIEEDQLALEFVSA